MFHRGHLQAYVIVFSSTMRQDNRQATAFMIRLGLFHVKKCLYKKLQKLKSITLSLKLAIQNILFFYHRHIQWFFSVRPTTYCIVCASVIVKICKTIILY